MKWLRSLTPAWITSDLSYREIRAAQACYGLSWRYAWLPGWCARRAIAQRVMFYATRKEIMSTITR